MEKPSTQVTRPIGVWILTVYAALFVGIVPLLFTILFGGSVSELGLGVFFAIPFYIATVFCAFKTWQGDRRALYYFLTLVTFNYVLVGINNLIYLLSNDVPTEESTRLLARVVRGVLFPAVFIGYFRKRSTLKFFRGKSGGSSINNQDRISGNYEIVGVYRIEPTLDTIKDAARYHKADWLLDEDGHYVDEINVSDFEDLSLVELAINGPFSGGDDLMRIKQGDQVPYMEFYLNVNGTVTISEETAKAVPSRRVCFFLHFTDINKFLEIGEMKFDLPTPTALPERLKLLTHYLPVD